MQSMPLPLTGVRVIEVCNVAAGPFCAMLLADMGADVVKVENPDGGDTLRSWPPINDGYSENFASLNRNKRSVTLDLKDPSDVEMLRRLGADAQVLIENNRPGVMDRLGMGYEALRALNPALVYCSISAYGQSGPRAQEGGFDLTIQAMSGIMSVTGEPGRPPVKCGVPLADFSAGLYAAFGIVSALRNAEATGEGTHSTCPCSARRWASPRSRPRNISAVAATLCNWARRIRAMRRTAFPQQGRLFRHGGGQQRAVEVRVRGVGREDLLADERFASPTLRARHQDALLVILEQEFAEADTAHGCRAFATRACPCAPINTYSQVLADPQVSTWSGCSRWSCPMASAHAPLLRRCAFAARACPCGAVRPPWASTTRKSWGRCARTRSR